MKPLTTVMLACVEFTKKQGGELKRYPGGYWAGEEWKSEYFGTNTVHGLVLRGAAEYSEWQDGRNGRFPIRIKLTGRPNP